MKIKHLILVSLFITFFCSQQLFPKSLSPSSNSEENSFKTKIDSVALKVLKETKAPSASIAVVRHGKIEYIHAYGDATLNPKKAAKPDMRYAIGSISKQFTAAAILLLEQEGKLSINDPVSKWLPDLTQADEVTIKKLLSHTSGYQDFWPQDYVPPMMLESMPPEEILNRWAKIPLDFEPGTRWQYSNTNFVIAALIVEKITKESFYEFLQKNILEPLKLSSAVNFDKGKFTKEDPTAYMQYGLGPLRPAPQEGSGWMAGAGELAMTPQDLAKWDISIINQSLLNPKSYKQLETEVLLKNGIGTGYGLGVHVGMEKNHRKISHGGEVSGFTAYNAVFPDDSAAVVVTVNQDASPATEAIAERIFDILFKAEDKETAARTEQAKKIFTDLQNGNIDRSLFTSNANSYFSETALQDFKTSLDSLGSIKAFVQTGQRERGGMLSRSFKVELQNQTLRVWTYQMPDGKLEQYQIAPQPIK